MWRNKGEYSKKFEKLVLTVMMTIIHTRWSLGSGGCAYESEGGGGRKRGTHKMIASSSSCSASSVCCCCCCCRLFAFNNNKQERQQQQICDPSGAVCAHQFRMFNPSPSTHSFRHRATGCCCCAEQKTHTQEFVGVFLFSSVVVVVVDLDGGGGEGMDGLMVNGATFAIAIVVHIWSLHSFIMLYTHTTLFVVVVVVVAWVHSHIGSKMANCNGGGEEGGGRPVPIA